MVTEYDIQQKYETLAPLMDERMRRCWAGIVADVLGKGGIALVARATGMSRTTVRAGCNELKAGARAVDLVRVRRAGGGRPRLEDTDPQLLTALESLVEPVLRGDPESPLRWTSKSTRKLAKALTDQGKPISPQKVGQLLFILGYRLHAFLKASEGTKHLDRDEQFELVNDRVEAYQARSAPVISVDTNKKELAGDFKNEAVPVPVLDFIDPGGGRAIPYGGCDLGPSTGLVTVRTDHDMPELAIESIARWWSQMGCKVYDSATELLITADAGGSNGYRSHLFKAALQRFADRTGLAIGVSHLPPGASKWSKVDHRLLYHITENWRGRSLIDHRAVIQLIGATRTTPGLRAKTRPERRSYPIHLKATDAGLQHSKSPPEDFHDDWNYTIAPAHRREP